MSRGNGSYRPTYVICKSIKTLWQLLVEAKLSRYQIRLVTYEPVALVSRSYSMGQKIQSQKCCIYSIQLSMCCRCLSCKDSLEPVGAKTSVREWSHRRKKNLTIQEKVDELHELHFVGFILGSLQSKFDSFDTSIMHDFHNNW